MFGRTTVFVAVLSGTVVALALLAQANRFGRETLWFALLLVSVALFIGVAHLPPLCRDQLRGRAG